MYEIEIFVIEHARFVREKNDALENIKIEKK